MAKTREEAEAETKALNSLARGNRTPFLVCRECNGKGQKFFPVNGDWMLGSEVLKCGSCGGTGNRVKLNG